MWVCSESSAIRAVSKRAGATFGLLFNGPWNECVHFLLQFVSLGLLLAMNFNMGREITAG